MRYVFVDESGTEAPFTGGRFLVVALLASDRPRDLDLTIRRARRKYGASLPSGEMKGDASPAEVTRYVLSTLAAAQVEIVAVVVDKTAIRRPPADPGVIYRLAVARAVRLAAEREPALDVCLDKRYTALRLRAALEVAVRAGVADLPAARLSISHVDSVTSAGLQLVDYVSWALFQKYERGNPAFCEMLAGRVVVEEVIERAVW